MSFRSFTKIIANSSITVKDDDEMLKKVGKFANYFVKISLWIHRESSI